MSKPSRSEVGPHAEPVEPDSIGFGGGYHSPYSKGTLVATNQCELLRRALLLLPDAVPNRRSLSPYLCHKRQWTWTSKCATNWPGMTHREGRAITNSPR